MNKVKFQQDLLIWYNAVKRDLPWRENQDPYRIWISEIMCQQTQVATVIPYFNRFLQLFPTVEALANADDETLHAAWEGLGYYSRARNMRTSAQLIQERGSFPSTYEEILALKGIGPYTAGAISSIAFNIPMPAVDGNVFRVMSRLLNIEDDIAKPATRKVFEQVVMDYISIEHPGDFNQALMELGATICTPKLVKCDYCPVKEHCQAVKLDKVYELPVKSKKVKQKVIDLAVAIIENEAGQWLVRQRPSDGLLANFYEFPQIEGEMETLFTAINDRGFLVQTVSYFNEAKHIFTHQVWNMTGVKFQVNSGEVLVETNEKWIEPERLNEISLSLAHQKLLKKKRVKE